MFTKLKKFKVVIGFKGGNVAEYTCTKFSVKSIGNDPSEITWENLEPTSLYMRLKDIQFITCKEI